MTRQAENFAEAASISKIAVIGAGEMGGGIAQVLAVAGYKIRLQDIAAERVQSFEEVELCLSEEQAMDEAKRCLRCDATSA